MASTTEPQHAHRTRWWLLGALAAAGVLALFTPWAVIVQLALLGMAIYRLTRRPPRAERVALIIAITILSTIILAFGTSALTAFLWESHTGGTSIPLS